MGLLEDFQNVGKNLPPSHVPAIADVQGVLGAVVAFLEHGQSVIDAAAAGDVASAATPDELHAVLAPVEQAAAETVEKAETAVGEAATELVAAPAAPAATEQAVEAVPVVTPELPPAAGGSTGELTPAEVQQLQALLARAHQTPTVTSEEPTA